jgi:hypothetical protein
VRQDEDGAFTIHDLEEHLRAVGDEQGEKDGGKPCK